MFRLPLLLLPLALATCAESASEPAPRPAKTARSAPRPKVGAPDLNSFLLPVGAPAPDFELERADGSTLRLSDLRGRVVVLDFWATWCAPCKRAMPKIQSLHETFADEPVTVIGISTGDRGDPVAYMESRGYTYEHLLNGETIAGPFKVFGVPVLYIVDRDGNVAHASLGLVPGLEEQLEDKVRELL